MVFSSAGDLVSLLALWAVMDVAVAKEPDLGDGTEPLVRLVTPSRGHAQVLESPPAAVDWNSSISSNSSNATFLPVRYCRDNDWFFGNTSICLRRFASTLWGCEYPPALLPPPAFQNTAEETRFPQGFLWANLCPLSCGKCVHHCIDLDEWLAPQIPDLCNMLVGLFGCKLDISTFDGLNWLPGVTILMLCPRSCNACHTPAPTVQMLAPTCTVDAQSRCIFTPNYPHPYGPPTSCAFELNAPARITVVDWHTESSYWWIDGWYSVFPPRNGTLVRRRLLFETYGPGLHHRGAMLCLEPLLHDRSVAPTLSPLPVAQTQAPTPGEYASRPSITWSPTHDPTIATWIIQVKSPRRGSLCAIDDDGVCFNSGVYGQDFSRYAYCYFVVSKPARLHVVHAPPPGVAVYSFWTDTGYFDGITEINGSTVRQLEVRFGWQYAHNQGFRICLEKMDAACSGGPWPGTATGDADFSSCSTLSSGDYCHPRFACRLGYQLPTQNKFILDCNGSKPGFDASVIADCVPRTCSDAFNIVPGVDYTPCIGRHTGELCSPQCPAGFRAASSINLTCGVRAPAVAGSVRPEEPPSDVESSPADQSDTQQGGAGEDYEEATCKDELRSITWGWGWSEENDCPHSSVMALRPCTCPLYRDLVRQCNEPLCDAKPDCLFYMSAGFAAQMLHNCGPGDVGESFDAHNVGCTPSNCSGGPLPGTAYAYATYERCNLQQSGDTCLPTFNCAPGFDSPIGDFPLLCDIDSQMYNASTPDRCIAVSCSTPLNKDARASYSSCVGMVSGDICWPQCTDGYNAPRGLPLVCSKLILSGSVQYVFDASDVSCIPNTCYGEGAVAGMGTLHELGSPQGTWNCSNLTTGQQCSFSCGPGYRAISQTGTFRVVCGVNGSVIAPGQLCMYVASGTGDCPTGPCINGEQQSDCTCKCNHRWASATCTVCPEPYREHLGCKLPDVPSLSLLIRDTGEITDFPIDDFISELSTRLPPSSGSPQVTFVCALPAEQVAITESDRRSAACCRPSSATQLCVPAAVGGGMRRGDALAQQNIVLDLEFDGAAVLPASVESLVQSAATGVGFELTATVADVCLSGQVRCGAVCADLRGYCNARGSVEELGRGNCQCRCDAYFAGSSCSICENLGTTLCTSSTTSLSVATPANHTVTVDGTWSLPADCSCPTPQAGCSALQCVTLPIQGVGDTGLRPWSACATGNSTVQCTFSSVGMPQKSLLYLKTPTGPEPRDARGEADRNGMLPLTFVGPATALSISVMQSSRGPHPLCRVPHAFAEIILSDTPANWTAVIAAIDDQGSEVGNFFEDDLCVPLRASISPPKGHSAAANSIGDIDVTRICSAETCAQSPAGELCTGVLGGLGTLHGRHLTVAGTRDIHIRSDPVPGSVHFAIPLKCSFALKVAPGEAAWIELDSNEFQWRLLLKKVSPPIVLHVMDVHGNTVGGPGQAAQVRVQLTDNDSDTFLTQAVGHRENDTNSSELKVPAPEFFAELDISDRGRAVFGESLALQGVAYGRPYALRFSLTNRPPVTRHLPFVLPLPMPRCPDESQMAVYGHSKCISCPPGLKCSGGHRTGVRKGYWRAVPWDYRARPCPHPSNCIGHYLPNDTSAGGFEEEGNESLCDAGARGPLCAICDAGWRLAAEAQGVTLRCERCGDSSYLLIAVIQVAGVFLLLVMLTWVSLPYTLDRTGRTGQMFKILIETVQVAGVVKQVPVVMDAMVGISKLVPLINFNGGLALMCTLPPVEYKSSLLLHGLLPFLIVPLALIAQQLVKLVRYCRKILSSEQDQGDDVGLQLDQQVLAACTACTAWGCQHCNTCRDTRCTPCLRNCIAKGHQLSPVPLMGEGCRLRLPVRYELLLGTMIGSFLVLPMMMEKFTERWQCVTFTFATSGKDCSALFPEKCDVEARLRGDTTVDCSDTGTAIASIACIIGWGGISAALLCLALHHAGTSGRVATEQAVEDVQPRRAVPEKGAAMSLASAVAHRGAKGDPGATRLPMEGLHSALAVGAWTKVYYAYRKPCWWWESYIIVWKTCIFICFALRQDRAFLFATLLCIAGTIAHFAAHPYHDKYVLWFSLIGHALLTSAMLGAMWLTLTEEPGESQSAIEFTDLDLFTQGVLVLVAGCTVAVLLGVAILFIRIVAQAIPLARQLRHSGEAIDADIGEPEALHVANMLVRLMGSPPKRLTHSAIEEWRARYAADLPPLSTEEDLEQLSSLFTSLLALATCGPLGELVKELPSPWLSSFAEVELARRAHGLLTKHGENMPGMGMVELLVLELYTMEGPDIDGAMGYEVPRWRTFMELDYAPQVLRAALERYKQSSSPDDDEEDDGSQLDEPGRAEQALVRELLQRLRGGLYDEIKGAQAAFKKYKEDVGDTRNQSLYRPVCAALRSVQGAAADTSGQALMKALSKVVEQGFLNVIMVLMYAASPVPELLGGEAELWRGLAGLPPAIHRWHRVLKPGSFVGWAAPTSASFDEQAAVSFAVGARSVLFRIVGVLEGVPLWCLSRYPHERELLLPPFTRWRVAAIEQGTPILITLQWLGSYRSKVADIATQRIVDDNARIEHMRQQRSSTSMTGPGQAQQHGIDRTLLPSPPYPPAAPKPSAPPPPPAASESESESESKDSERPADDGQAQVSLKSAALLPEGPLPPLPPAPVRRTASIQRSGLHGDSHSPDMVRDDIDLLAQEGVAVSAAGPAELPGTTPSPSPRADDQGGAAAPAPGTLAASGLGSFLSASDAIVQVRSPATVAADDISPILGSPKAFAPEGGGQGSPSWCRAQSSSELVQAQASMCSGSPLLGAAGSPPPASSPHAPPCALSS